MFRSRSIFRPSSVTLLLGLGFAQSAMAYPTPLSDCDPGSTLGMSLATYSCDAVCNETAVGTIVCDLDSVSTSAWEAQVVTDGAGTTLCGDDYCAWGDDGTSTFCCTASAGSNILLVELYGSIDADTLSFTWSTYDLYDAASSSAPFGGEIYGGSQDDVITGSNTVSSVYKNSLYGELGADVIRGGAGQDFISGGDQDDLISGNAGDDFLVGNGGGDLVCGGSGVDSVFGDAGNDILWDLNTGDLVQGDAGGADQCGNCSFVMCSATCEGPVISSPPACP